MQEDKSEETNPQLREVVATVADITAWLQDNSTEDPVIYPYWPEDPAIMVVGLRALEHAWELIVPLTREAMLTQRHPQRLWFFITRKMLVEGTDADPDWLDRRSD